VLKIHNLAVSQQLALGGAVTTKGGGVAQLSGTFMRPVRNQSSKGRGGGASAISVGRVVTTPGGGGGASAGGLSAADEQAMADLCQDLAQAAIAQRGRKADFDELLHVSVLQIFVDTVVQMHADKAS